MHENRASFYLNYSAITYLLLWSNTAVFYKLIKHIINQMVKVFALTIFLVAYSFYPVDVGQKSMGKSNWLIGMLESSLTYLFTFWKLNTF